MTASRPAPGPATPARRVEGADRTPREAQDERPLYEQVAEQLRARIVSQQLPAGGWIDEQVLVHELGISRTPLREALKVLASEGLVTIKPRRGAYVTEVTERDVREVYHLLTLLESDAAAQVARRGSEQALRELADLHAQLQAAVDDRDQFFAVNEAFHLRLLDLAGNRWACQVVSDLRKVMKLNRHHSLFRQGRLHASLAEHHAILQALLQRDDNAARRQMEAHFRNGLRAAAADARWGIPAGSRAPA